MKQEQQALTAQSVITYHMKEAESRGDIPSNLKNRLHVVVPVDMNSIMCYDAFVEKRK